MIGRRPAQCLAAFLLALFVLGFALGAGIALGSILADGQLP